MLSGYLLGYAVGSIWSHRIDWEPTREGWFKQSLFRERLAEMEQDRNAVCPVMFNSFEGTVRHSMDKTLITSPPDGYEYGDEVGTVPEKDGVRPCRSRCAATVEWFRRLESQGIESARIRGVFRKYLEVTTEDGETHTQRIA